MFSKKTLVSTSTLILLLLFSVQSVSADTLTWHSSVKEGASWQWKVTNLGGDLDTFFGTTFDDFKEGIEIEVRAVSNPPSDGEWGILASSASIAWADFYINGTQSTDETFLYFFIAPVDVGNGMYGWEAQILLFYTITMFMGANFDESNSTSGDLITYQFSNSGGIGSFQVSVAHTIVYEISTGILNRYTLELSYPTNSSSVTINRVGAGKLKISGFEGAVTIFGIFILSVIPILKKRK
ncbi:MAG: hypothetical protein ACXABI_12660 [Candidatus Hodarchaeales archaeon]